MISCLENLPTGVALKVQAEIFMHKLFVKLPVYFSFKSLLTELTLKDFFILMNILDVELQGFPSFQNLATGVALDVQADVNIVRQLDFLLQLFCDCQPFSTFGFAHLSRLGHQQLNLFSSICCTIALEKD